MRPPAGEYKTTSFSGMEKWLSCSTLHSLHYSGQLSPTVEEPLLIGGLAHLLIEGIINDELTEQAEKELLFAGALPELLASLNLDEELGAEYYELLEVAVGLGAVLYRTYPQCRKAPIRNKDKSVPKDPINFPPRDFADAIEEAGLSEAKYIFDTMAGRANSFFLDVSLCWLLAKVVSMTFWWERSSWVSKSLEVELPISTHDENLVPFLSGYQEPTTYFKGYVDWVVEIQGELAIIDHKTSKKKPSEFDVLHHPQLNLYAWAYKKLYGKTPKYLGINHLLTNTLVLAQLDTEIMASTVQFYQQVQGNIEHQLLLRHHPAEFNSPCIKTNWKTGVVTPCLGLENCWPIYAETLNSFQAEIQS